MNAVLWIALALAFGLLMFTSLQSSLPDELNMFKSQGGDNGVEMLGTTTTGAERRNFNYLGWNVRQEGPTVELTRKFSGLIQAKGAVYDNPEIGFLCHLNKLDVRINTRNAVMGTRITPLTVSAGSMQTWSKGTDMNIFPGSPKTFAGDMAKSMRPVDFKFTFSELGAHTVTLKVEGLSVLLKKLPSGCSY
jgi:hypothetical protein